MKSSYKHNLHTTVIFYLVPMLSRNLVMAHKKSNNKIAVVVKVAEVMTRRRRLQTAALQPLKRTGITQILLKSLKDGIIHYTLQRHKASVIILNPNHGHKLIN